MITLLNLNFFRNAVVISFILSILFGIFSFFIVSRKMAFLGVGISHTAFGGVALGILFNLNPFFTALVFCLFSAIIIGKVAKYGKISLNTSIGIYFSFAMAMGAVLIKLKQSYNFDLSGYLFGNILGIRSFDIWTALCLLVIFLFLILFFFNRILFLTFDEEVALISGVSVGLLDTILLFLLAAIIVVSMKMVGIILVSALVVLPASFGSLLSSNYRGIIWWGIVFNLFIIVGGLFLSYFLKTPPGATMVTSGTLIYFISMIATYLLRR